MTPVTPNNVADGRTSKEPQNRNVQSDNDENRQSEETNSQGKQGTGGSANPYRRRGPYRGPGNYYVRENNPSRGPSSAPQVKSGGYPPRNDVRASAGTSGYRGGPSERQQNNYEPRREAGEYGGTNANRNFQDRGAVAPPQPPPQPQQQPPMDPVAFQQLQQQCMHLQSQMMMMQQQMQMQLQLQSRLAPTERPPRELDETNIYVSHLPRDMTQEAFVELMSQFGTVLSSRVLIGNGWEKKGVKGVGFARMASEDEATAAIKGVNYLKLPGNLTPLRARLAFKTIRNYPGANDEDDFDQSSMQADGLRSAASSVGLLPLPGLLPTPAVNPSLLGMYDQRDVAGVYPNFQPGIDPNALASFQQYNPYNIAAYYQGMVPMPAGTVGLPGGGVNMQSFVPGRANQQPLLPLPQGPRMRPPARGFMDAAVQAGSNGPQVLDPKAFADLNGWIGQGYSPDCFLTPHLPPAVSGVAAAPGHQPGSASGSRANPRPQGQAQPRPGQGEIPAGHQPTGTRESSTSNRTSKSEGDHPNMNASDVDAVADVFKQLGVTGTGEEAGATNSMKEETPVLGQLPGLIGTEMLPPSERFAAGGEDPETSVAEQVRKFQLAQQWAIAIKPVGFPVKSEKSLDDFIQEDIPFLTTVHLCEDHELDDEPGFSIRLTAPFVEVLVTLPETHASLETVKSLTAVMWVSHGSLPPSVILHFRDMTQVHASAPDHDGPHQGFDNEDYTFAAPHPLMGAAYSNVYVNA